MADGLTYTRTRTRTETTTEEVALRVPDEWAMYKARGNRRLKKMGQKAADRLEEVLDEHEPGEERDEAVRKVLFDYVAEWDGLGYTKTYSEASDTAVREMVASFFDKLSKAGGIYDKWSADEFWQEAVAAAYKKHRDKEYA